MRISRPRGRMAAVIVALAAVVAAAGPVAAPAAHAASARTAAAPFGQLPVMGYNTWYQYGAGATESDGARSRPSTWSAAGWPPPATTR